jgi:GST-like protein
LAAGVSEADYDAWRIDIYKGDQFGSGFVDLNPNSKIPALIDYGASSPFRIFESGAILLYLAESSASSFPLMLQGAWNACLGFSGKLEALHIWVVDLPHFYHYGPIKLEYAIDRFTMEAKRQLHVLDQRLAGRPSILGKDYSVADIASFSWYGGLMLG